MAIDSTDIELFQNGNAFEQILYLDNFYNNVSVETEIGEKISNVLVAAIDNSLNNYVKRSAFKILIDLTLVKKIPNVFSTLGILVQFLKSDEEMFQEIALKYLPHFTEGHTSENTEILKKLTDSPNGDVASQAYLCLGLIQLSLIPSKIDVFQLTTNLNQAKIDFHAAAQAAENRVDAEFYILLIEWSQSLIKDDLSSSNDKFDQIEANLQSRKLYDFTGTGIELDFLIFQLIQKVRASFKKARASKSWVNIPDEIRILGKIHLEIQNILNSDSTNHVLLTRLSHGTLQILENSIYIAHLKSETPRLNYLKSKSQESGLMEFVEHLLSIFPDDDKEEKDNYELLALLSENLGSESGLSVYNQIKNKEVSLEKALDSLLRKNKENQLSYRTGSIIGQEVLFSLMSELNELLPNFPKYKFQTFCNILEEVIRYARTTMVGHDKKQYSFLFSEAENGKGQKAVEQDLQDSMYTYFGHSKIADGLDHERPKFVDGGRVDIVYKKDLVTIPIELKKSFIRPDKNALEQFYIAQAQTYTAGYDQLGIFILLELSDKSKEAPANFRDWFRVHHLEPSTNLEIKHPDYIISVVIPGNKTMPSSKSTYK